VFAVEDVLAVEPVVLGVDCVIGAEVVCVEHVTAVEHDGLVVEDAELAVVAVHVGIDVADGQIVDVGHVVAGHVVIAVDAGHFGFAAEHSETGSSVVLVHEKTHDA
jgi:hypothetical protein